MPELPEVETVVRELRSQVIGKDISQIVSLRDGTVNDRRENVSEIGVVISVRRRGKYIIIDTMNDVLLVHLRMTGKLIYAAEPGERSRFCRAEIHFKDGSLLYFDDVRTFGGIDILQKSELDGALSKLGVEPFSDEFTTSYLQKRMRNRIAPVKSILLDQREIAGLGNIYVCEILHRAGISPKRSGGKLSLEEIEKIVKETRQVLSEAIDKNGTTISDYRRVDNKQGEFQNFLRVYGKKRCHCGEEIARIKQSGRSSYYCPSCQK